MPITLDCKPVSSPRRDEEGSDRPRLAVIGLTIPPRKRTFGAHSGSRFVNLGEVGEKQGLLRLPRQHFKIWRLLRFRGTNQGRRVELGIIGVVIAAIRSKNLSIVLFA